MLQIYKHDKNLQVDHFLTAILVLALALVIGLGIGHFLGEYFITLIFMRAIEVFIHLHKFRNISVSDNKYRLKSLWLES